MTTLAIPPAVTCRRCARAKLPCRRCHAARIAKLQAEAAAVVEKGTCPCCGTALVRNLALTGWWQCGAYATDSHRKPEHRGLPSCSFQCFTA